MSAFFLTVEICKYYYIVFLIFFKLGCGQRLPYAIMTIVAFVLIYGEYNKREMSDNQNKYNSEQTNSKLNNLKITIPSSFEDDSSSGESYKMYFSKDYRCILTLVCIEMGHYESAKDYLKAKAYYTENDKYSGITTKRINSYSWETSTKESTYYLTYYFATVKDNLIYYVELSTPLDNNSCPKAYNYITNSLGFK